MAGNKTRAELKQEGRELVAEMDRVITEMEALPAEGHVAVAKKAAQLRRARIQRARAAIALAHG